MYSVIFLELSVLVNSFVLVGIEISYLLVLQTFSHTLNRYLLRGTCIRLRNSYTYFDVTLNLKGLTFKRKANGLVSLHLNSSNAVMKEQLAKFIEND